MSWTKSPPGPCILVRRDGQRNKREGRTHGVPDGGSSVERREEDGEQGGSRGAGEGWLSDTLTTNKTV